MKKKVLPLLLTLASLSLSACSTGINYAIEDYIVKKVAYKDDYKILQLTDIHLSDKDDQDVQFAFMDLTINEANPDLIVVTGDLFTFASKSTALRLFNFLDGHGIDWTVTFGNHDEQCYFSIDWLTDTLNNFGPHCLFKDIQDDDVFGNANFAINLMKDEKVFEQLIVMDSNRYYFGSYSGYDYFKQNQIDWYEKIINKTKENNGGVTVPSLMFYHIPLPEIDVAYDEALAAGKVHGVKGEKSCPPKFNSGFFAKIKELGSTNAMFFGHDHDNCFWVEYEGVIFSYGLKSTDRLYYDEKLLGGQTITIKNDHTVEINQIYHTYAEVK